MPKQVVTLNDFAGGLNNVTAPRDLSGKQLSVCKNFDPSSPGQLVTTTIGGITLYEVTSNEPGTAPTAGGDAFVFSADYKMDQFSAVAANGTNAAALSSEFICTRDNTAFDALELNTAANLWRVNIFGADVGNPADFYSAEGDLFAGSEDTTKVPMSLQFIDRTHVNGDSVKKWKQLSQDKVAPDHATSSGTGTIGMDFFDKDFIDAGIDVTNNFDFFCWGLLFNTTADTGTWNNDVDGVHWVMGSSFVHKNGAESAIVEIGDTSNAVGPGGNGFTDESNKSAKICALIKSSSGDYRDQIYGAKLYTKESTTNTWYLLAEADFKKGIKGDGEDGFTAWGTSIPTGFSEDITGTVHSAATGYITSPPVLITYELANGFCTSDLPTNRQVNWKCSVVANSRAYVGNVTLKDVGTFGDRLLKSPVFQYDTFTADSYIDVAPNDGDQIMALEAYADRILMFKEKVLYILNASKELEFLESEHRFAGVKIQGAITKTPFGVAWVNNNGCYFYDGESVNLLQLGKIKDLDWGDNITDNAIIGYDELNQQLVVIWDSSSSGSGNGYIYSFSSGCWHELTAAFTSAASGQTVNMSNFINLNGYNLAYIGGDELGVIHKWAVNTTNVASGNVTTADIHFGNYESKKNICGLTVTHKSVSNGLTVQGRGNLASSFTAIGTLNTGANMQVQRFDLTSTTAFQGINTFQIELSGTLDDELEIEDISITYRDLGVH